MKNLLLALLTLCAWSGWAHGQNVVRGQTAGDMRLYGMGEYENLGEMIYIGALYIPQLDDGLRPGASATMEMAIVADDLSARRFTQLWMDAITLSSSREERVALIPQIQAFSGMFQDRLMRGDRVSFVYLESVGQTSVIIDEVRLGEIPGTGFFNILLNAWVGDTPLSGRLKSGILERNGADERVRIERQFADTGYAESRHRDVARIYASESVSQANARADAAVNDEHRQSPGHEDKPAAAPANAAMTETAAAAAARLAAESAAQREEEARLAAERAEAERVRQAMLAAEREEKAKAAAELARIAQEQLAAEYRSELIKWLSNYADYPQRALERGQEGKVDLVVRTNRHGEILSKEIVTSSGDSALDHAAMRMLERGSPLPAMPEKLAGDTFVFNMPVNFSL